MLLKESNKLTQENKYNEIDKLIELAKQDKPISREELNIKTPKSKDCMNTYKWI